MWPEVRGHPYPPGSMIWMTKQPDAFQIVDVAQFVRVHVCVCVFFFFVLLSWFCLVCDICRVWSWSAVFRLNSAQLQP